MTPVCVVISDDDEDEPLTTAAPDGLARGPAARRTASSTSPGLSSPLGRRASGGTRKRQRQKVAGTDGLRQAKLRLDPRTAAVVVVDVGDAPTPRGAPQHAPLGPVEHAPLGPVDLTTPQVPAQVAGRAGPSEQKQEVKGRAPARTGPAQEAAEPATASSAADAEAPSEDDAGSASSCETRDGSDSDSETANEPVADDELAKRRLQESSADVESALLLRALYADSDTAIEMLAARKDIREILAGAVCKEPRLRSSVLGMAVPDQDPELEQALRHADKVVQSAKRKPKGKRKTRSG